MNIAFIPIDNRPVCYTLPEQICAMNEGVHLFMPERKFLGGLKQCANIGAIFEWLENLKNIDVFVMSLDTVAYGGLIPSRRSKDTFEQIKTRIEELKNILQGKKVFAFSSIMRISNNNINEEEKEYWNKWGRKIFDYSYKSHKFGRVDFCDIPDEILSDYLETRKRNFEINKIYLDYQKSGLFDTLVFSKDDCAEFGLNVKEAQELEKLGGFVKTGADEIPLTLLARAIDYGKNNSKIKVAPIFLAFEYKHLISNYEDVSIENSVKGQLNLAGCEICEPENADILLYVNNFIQNQGEIVMKVPTKLFDGCWHKPDKPYMVADVRNANGADNEFVKKLFDTQLDENFLGYAAWNTSANSLGSLICAAKMKFLAKQSKNFVSNNFKKLQVIRFLDDWAYQANVRQELSDLDTELLKEKMKSYEKIVFKKLNVEYNISYKFPWDRLFEVEVELN